MIYLLCLLGLVAGGAGGFFAGRAQLKKLTDNLAEENGKKAALILQEAEMKAETIRKEKALEAKEYFLKLKTFACAVLFQQVIVAQPAFAKAMIISDDHGMRAKLCEKKVFYIFFSGQLRKSLGERNNDQVVDV